MTTQTHSPRTAYPQKTTTLPYKLMYGMMVGIMALAVMSGSFYLQDDPRFKLRSLVSGAKHWIYASTFAAENAFGAANAISGFDRQTSGSGAGARSIPVLVYHGIIPKADNSRINITEEQFKEHLFALKRAGYTTITLPELYEFARGERELPSRSIMITFDDGRADSFYNGDPILAALDYSAVMFPISKYVDEATLGSYYLSTEEIKLMAATGRWEIGSHSDQGHEQYQISESGDQGNFFSNYLWLEEEDRAETSEEFRERIRFDFATSRQYFEDLLGLPIHSFAFPFGDLGQNQKDAREKTGEIIGAASDVYRLLFYQYSPGEYFTQLTPKENTTDNALLVRRINMESSWGAEKLLDVLEDGTEKALPFQDSFEEDHGWVDIWGEHIIEDGALRMQASELQTGASTVLDGSASWTNYTVHAEVESPQRTGVFIWTRFRDDNHNAACNFGDNFVHAEQIWDGQKRVLKGVQRPASIPEGPFTLTARVEGRTLICSINDVEIVRTEFLEPTLDSGGIGVKIWDEEFGKSSVIIRQLSVEPINSDE